LTNGDFHNGLSDWTPYNISNGSVKVEQDADGSIMLHVHSNGTSDDVKSIGVYNYNVISLSTDEEWTASAMIKGNANITRFTIEASKNPEGEYPTPSDSWEKIVTSNVKAARDDFCIYIDSGDLYVRLVKLERGNIATDWTPAPEVLVKKNDTSNYQKTKITNDDGSLIKLWTADQGGSLKNYLWGLPLGMTTFYCQNGVTDNPSTGPIRGFFLMTGVDVAGNHKKGIGFAVNATANESWSIACNDSVSFKQLSTVATTAPVAAMAYTAMVQNDTNSKLQAQNSQIAYSLMTGDTSNAK